MSHTLPDDLQKIHLLPVVPERVIEAGRKRFGRLKAQQRSFGGFASITGTAMSGALRRLSQPLAQRLLRPNGVQMQSRGFAAGDAL